MNTIEFLSSSDVIWARVPFIKTKIKNLPEGPAIMSILFWSGSLAASNIITTQKLAK